MWVFDEAFLEELAGKWDTWFCRPGGRCRDCYPGAPTVCRGNAAHLGSGCPMILPPPSFIFGQPILSWVAWSRGLGIGTQMAGRGGGSGIGCRATCPISFHYISKRLGCIVYETQCWQMYICCIYILTIYIFWIWIIWIWIWNLNVSRLVLQ